MGGREVTKLRVNGQVHQLHADPGAPLLWVLREGLGLTGCKPGCGEGECGACTVLVDGEPVRACITPLSEVEGRDVLTIEGLEQRGELHPVQQAFVDAGAMQCGYCTPGMIMSALGLLSSNPDPSEQEIVESMQGNVCRCGCYPRIVRAIRQAAVAMRPEAVTGGVR